MHEQGTIAAQDACYFPKRQLGTRDVVAGSEVDGEIEGPVRERQLADVGADELCLDAAGVEPSPRFEQDSGIDVDSGQLSRLAQLGERDQRDPPAAPELEDPRAARDRK